MSVAESKYQVVLFDLGRVLVHIDFNAFPAALGLHTEEDRYPYSKLFTAEAKKFETGKVTTNEFCHSLEKIFEGRFSRRRIFDAWNEIICTENSPITEVVERVRAVSQIAILSNTSESHWNRALICSPVVRSIACCFLSYRLGAAKPDPAVYETVSSSLRLPPEKILFIDDLEENIAGAQKSGMAGIVYTAVPQLIMELENLGVW